MPYRWPWSPGISQPTGRQRGATMASWQRLPHGSAEDGDGSEDSRGEFFNMKQPFLFEDFYLRNQNPWHVFFWGDVRIEATQ